ncbi:MAG: methylated-DNA--[protein]-cysteine S-methyltransferase [Treponema sp.]|nr:methylated-DNA--[protein]-cysteine S-methyltransferase [Treponema sp.]
MEYFQKIKSPVGMLTVSCDGENITGLWIEGQKYFANGLEKNAEEKKFPVLEKAQNWLDLYFSGKKPDIKLNFLPKGTPYQKSIWNILQKIPYGKTVTYGEIASQYKIKNGGKQTSARAVGAAVGKNPISIFIPCHRVIGKDGSLTGYAGGLSKKTLLLQIEGININDKYHS